MKTRHGIASILVAAGILLLSAFLHCSAVSADALYDPSVTYPGPYDSNKIYYSTNIKNLNRTWEPGDFKGPESIICPQAHKKLLEQGVWRGRLAGNGSCGTNAPVRIWAVGNLVNYEKSIPFPK
jgi:hypothetical protein